MKLGLFERKKLFSLGGEFSSHRSLETFCRVYRRLKLNSSSSAKKQGVLRVVQKSPGRQMAVSSRENQLIENLSKTKNFFRNDRLEGFSEILVGDLKNIQLNLLKLKRFWISRFHNLP